MTGTGILAGCVVVAGGALLGWIIGECGIDIIDTVRNWWSRWIRK